MWWCFSVMQTLAMKECPNVSAGHNIGPWRVWLPRGKRPNTVASTNMSTSKQFLPYMQQSRVEIKDYSVMNFDHFAVFKATYRWTSVEGGAHTRFADSLDIHASTNHPWAPPLAFSDAALQTQQCDQNMQRNNLQFHHETATRSSIIWL